PQPFASLPTPPSSSSSSSASSSSSSTSSSASPSIITELTSDHPSPASSAESLSSATILPLSSSSTGKAILFDSQGVPYMVIDGQSTSFPTELAEKIMHAAEHTDATPPATDTSALSNATNVPKDLPPLTIPVVDSADMPAPKPTSTRKGLVGLAPPPVATNLFDTPPPALASNAAATATKSPAATATGFAATFFLTLDTNTPASGSNLQSTTVIPFSQMMASASAASSQSTNVLSKTAVAPELASDPLATSSSTSTSAPKLL
ncbi:hypothetical protein EV175_006391, partial [Coemansia sp. RSA 1933]